MFSLIRLGALAMCAFLLSPGLTACRGETASTIVQTKMQEVRAMSLPFGVSMSQASTEAQGGPLAEITPSISPMKSYQGNGYTISYPADWSINQGTTNVTMTEPAMQYGIAIVSLNNPNGTIDANEGLQLEAKDLASNLSNVQDDNIASTTTEGGETWYQKEFTGTFQGEKVTYAIMVTNHPANTSGTKIFEEVYFAPTNQFSQVKAAYIQPMLTSFAFTA
ncbi:MAG TPA: hypothetical protein VKR06_05710 [Ktedonosporobacter sp.]|nr:hypothetical protein [Ktedonosporobacter sp.]